MLEAGRGYLVKLLPKPRVAFHFHTFSVKRVREAFFVCSRGKKPTNPTLGFVSQYFFWMVVGPMQLRGFSSSGAQGVQGGGNKNKTRHGCNAPEQLRGDEVFGGGFLWSKENYDLKTYLCAIIFTNDL